MQFIIHIIFKYIYLLIHRLYLFDVLSISGFPYEFLVLFGSFMFGSGRIGWSKSKCAHLLHCVLGVGVVYFSVVYVV